MAYRMRFIFPMLLIGIILLSGCLESSKSGDTYYFKDQNISGGNDSNKVKVSSADANADYLFSKLQAGSGITLAIQNPGADENIIISSSGPAGDTNCSNNTSCILTGSILTSLPGLMNDLNISGDLNMLGTAPINFGGPTPDWNLWADTTNDFLMLRKKTAGAGRLDLNNLSFKINNIGFNNADPSANFLIFAGLGTETSARGILTGQLIYTGTLGPTAANFGMDYNGASNTVTSNGAQFYVRSQRNATTSTNMAGIIGETGLKPTSNVRFTTGTYDFDAFRTIINGTDANTFVTGGTYRARGFLQQLIEDFNTFGTKWGSIWNNDVQLNADVNLVWDGPDNNTKGNTITVYSGNALQHSVDANRNATWDSNGNTNWVKQDFQEDINAKKNIYGQYVGMTTDASTSCNTMCDIIDGNGGNWTCMVATTLSAGATTCSDATVSKNCLCKN